MKRKNNPYDANKNQGAMKVRKLAHSRAANQFFQNPRLQPVAFRMQQHETKFVDVPTAATTYLSTTPGVLINPVQTGAAYWQRIGNKIQPLSIRVMGFITNIATAIQSQIRTIVVLDKNPSSSAAGIPALTVVLGERDQAGTATNGYLSMANLDNRNRFIVLRDEHICTPSVTNTAGVLTNLGDIDSNTTMEFDFYIKLRKYGTMQFSGTANPMTVAQINTNAIYMYFLTQAANDNKWQAIVGTRFKYTDV